VDPCPSWQRSGKRISGGFYDNDGVVDVTLLLAGPATFQVVPRRDVCRMLANQKDGIGQTLLESRFVTADSISRRTRALEALVGRARGAGSVASPDLADKVAHGCGRSSVMARRFHLRLL
jgi:hypothetical protein